MLKFPKSKAGLILAGIYLGLFLLAGCFALYLLVFHTKDSAFGALPAVMLAMPWSLIILPIEEALGFIKWYEQFAGRPLVYGFFALLAILPAAIINATILYFVGKLSASTKVKILSTRKSGRTSIKS